MFRELETTSNYFQGFGKQALKFRSCGVQNMSEYEFLTCFWLPGGGGGGGWGAGSGCSP